MVKKSKVSELKQLDILAAFRNEEIFVEVPVEEKIEKSTLTPWDFVNDIRKFKTGKMLDDDQNHSMFDKYMILRFLSMKTTDMFIVNFFNEYSSIMTKEQLYIALVHFIPKDNGFYKYIKGLKEEKGKYIEFVARYYECSEEEAFDYIQAMGDDWAKMIRDKFGDLI